MAFPPPEYRGKPLHQTGSPQTDEFLCNIEGFSAYVSRNGLNGRSSPDYALYGEEDFCVAHILGTTDYIIHDSQSEEHMIDLLIIVIKQDLEKAEVDWL